MPIAQIFIYLQVLDFLTTVVGFRFGAGEASPFIRSLMQLGPAFGVAASKVLALSLGGICVYLHKEHILRWMSYWYGGLVVWNLCVILVAAGKS